MQTKKTKLINPNWHGTLEFLAGMVDQDKVEELVEEASRNYFERKENGAINAEILSEMDLAYRITSDQPLSGKKKLSHLLKEIPCFMHKDYFRNLSEKTQNFMLDYTRKTMPEWARAKKRATAWLIIPSFLLLTGLGIGAWWYYNNSSKEEVSKVEVKTLPPTEVQKENYFEQKAKLLREGKKECEELSFSSDLIECYRYYSFNKAGKIIEEGYKDGFRSVQATSVPDYLGSIVQKKLVWKLTPEKCFTAYHAGAGKVILEMDYNHFWEWEYSDQEKAHNAALTLRTFCKKKEEDLTEQDYPQIKTSPFYEDFSNRLAEGRKDCDKINYSPQAMECLKEYLTDEEGNVMKSEYEENIGLSFSDNPDEDDSWENELHLVWRIDSKECQRAYNAGAGVVIMEMKDGRVWEFKHYSISNLGHPGHYPKKAKKEVSAEEAERWYQEYLEGEKETPEPYLIDAESMAGNLQMFCDGTHLRKQQLQL
jgi:hypothetical protein